MSKFAYVALTCAAMSFVVSAPAMAQDAAAMTSGGDVTAEEATPLPPVVVEAPSQPLARKKKPQKSIGSAGSAPAPTAPQQGPATADGPGGGTGTAGIGVYTLGQLDLIGGSTITNEAMYTFNKNTLDQALSIVPGVSVQQSGNSRNERDIQVRGFDRFRVPLYMDGVRMYLPADNRLDFNRFLTADIAEVQVQKGYVSVLNGPGGLGGAINLVSPQADQGGRARGPRRRRVRRRPGLDGPVEQLRLRRHAPEGLLRADQRHHRRPGPLRHVG